MRLFHGYDGGQYDHTHHNWFCRLIGNHAWCLPEGMYIIGDRITEKCNRHGCKAERTVILEATGRRLP